MSTDYSWKVLACLNLGLELYGRNWKLLQKMVPQRSASQIRSHAQKYFQKLNKSDQQATLVHSADIS